MNICATLQLFFEDGWAEWANTNLYYSLRDQDLHDDRFCVELPDMWQFLTQDADGLDFDVLCVKHLKYSVQELFIRLVTLRHRGTHRKPYIPLSILILMAEDVKTGFLLIKDERRAKTVRFLTGLNITH